MKKISAGILLLLLSILNAASQVYDKHCYYGISFDISKNKNWGFGELIITEVEPFSAAEAAGIKVNDIIMEIDGKATYLRDYATIADWLFDNPNPTVKFTIRNVNINFKEYTLERQCIAVNSVNEQALSKVFSFYSLENSREQNFTIPLKVMPADSVDYTDYHSFGFYEDGQNTTAIDQRIKAALEKALIRKGLTRNNTDPDLWISFYYEFTKNPLFTGLVTAPLNSGMQRFNLATNKMERLPILDWKESSTASKAPYVAKLGITFFERKYIDAAKYTQIWECNIHDYLADNFSLEEYADRHIPLMMMQYPYAEGKKQANYLATFSKYNYTGLHFDSEEPGKVKDVDVNSPAYNAGIRAGYTIGKINGKNLNINMAQITQGYKKFYEDTKKFRNPNSKFTGAEGYKDCMFWDRAYYADIAKTFKTDEYQTVFSYLFDFAEYIHSNGKEAMTIEAWDGIQKRIFSVTPIIRESTTLKIK